MVVPGDTPCGIEGRNEGSLDADRKETSRIPGKRSASSNCSPPASTHDTPERGGCYFPYPVYKKWFTNYRRENPALQITYDPIGSEAGVRELLANNVDFGASDSPQAIHELAPR